MIQRLMVFGILALPCPALLADMVQLANGDTVSGTLVAVTSTNVLIDSPLLGSVRLLRADVRAVRFGTKQQIQADIQKDNAALIKAVTAKVMAAKVGAQRNAADARFGQGPPKQAGANPARGARQAKGNQDIDAAMQQLQQLFPGAAGAGVENQVRDQLDKIIAGKMGVGDVRNQAADAGKQLREMKREMQKTGTWNPMYDMYLGILDDFVDRVDDGEGLEK